MSDTAAYVVRRLTRDAATDATLRDLLARVQRGEMSAHRAALLAGYRRPPSALDQLERWWRKADPMARGLFKARHWREWAGEPPVRDVGAEHG